MSWLVRFSTNFSSQEQASEVGESAGIAIELLESALWDRGCTGLFQPQDGEIVAGFDTNQQAVAVETYLRTASGVVVDSIVVSQAPTATEIAAQYGNQYPDHDKPGPVSVSTDRSQVELMIRAGDAFGHGGHPSTRLALDLMANRCQRANSVLDIGTGTGVLAIAAAALGVSDVVAIDNDPPAVNMAIENATRNNVEILCDSSTIAQVLERRDGRGFDLVVINVLLTVHRHLASEALGAINPGGAIVTSGYLFDQVDELSALYLSSEALHSGGRGPRLSRNLVVAESHQIDDWSGHLFDLT